MVSSVLELPGERGLLDLRRNVVVVADVEVLHELLRDRRAALHDPALVRTFTYGGPEDRLQIHAVVAEEAPVLDRHDRLAQVLRHLAGREHDAILDRVQLGDQGTVRRVQEGGLRERPLAEVVEVGTPLHAAVSAARTASIARRAPDLTHRAPGYPGALVPTGSIRLPMAQDALPIADDRALLRSCRRAASRTSSSARVEGRPLRIKLGLDPTAPAVTLGWAVVLRKLRQFQEAGHTAVLIVGDFTARVGDPSGKSETRPRLTKEEVDGYAERLLRQFGRVLDIERAEIRRNAEWLEPLGMDDVVAPHRLDDGRQDARARRLRRRYEAGKPISLMEFLYPLLQGYDSVAVSRPTWSSAAPISCSTCSWVGTCSATSGRSRRWRSRCRSSKDWTVCRR